MVISENNGKVERWKGGKVEKWQPWKMEYRIV